MRTVKADRMVASHHAARKYRAVRQREILDDIIAACGFVIVASRRVSRGAAVLRKALQEVR